MANRLAARDLAVPAPARGQPGRLVRRGARRRSRAPAREDKPLLVSIGYSACHWCHVMERESFEDAEIAALMNEHFVCVKVDREERPDVDAIYMDAVQAMTGHGGWPLNAFLTPERRAVLRRHLLPARAAPRDAELAAGAGRASPRRGASSATRSTRSRRRSLPRLRGAAALQAPEDELDPAALDAAVGDAARAATTPSDGGFGARAEVPAPRRRSSSCSRRGEREMSLHTLRAMATGGIYDQVGGGFARYSVDARWIVPHFEKMLYDNALLARAYLHGWQVSGEPLLPARVRGDARLHAARAAPAGGRVRLGARRRLRGRRGQVLRVDAGRGARRARRELADVAIERLRHDRGRQLRGREHPRARDARPRGAARDQAPGCTARASSACGRGSTTSA